MLRGALQASSQIERRILFSFFSFPPAVQMPAPSQSLIPTPAFSLFVALAAGPYMRLLSTKLAGCCSRRIS
jgi:hypothetical protein